MTYRKGSRRQGSSISPDQKEKGITLKAEEIGPNWSAIVPEKVQINDLRRYSYREIKAFALDSPNAKLAQLLIVIFDFGDEKEAREAYQEIGKGFEADVPRAPNVGQESVIYDLDMQPLVKMKVAAFREHTWLAVFTLWLFQDFDLDDSWMKEVMSIQMRSIKERM